MHAPHLFEWMDVERLPASLRNTLREILECGNARPFRPYYEWVAEEVKRQILKEGYRNVVELGAGTAPNTRILAKDRSLGDVRLFVCDLNPDTEAFNDLAKKHAGRVTPIMEPVDFSQPRSWPPQTLVFLSGTFHHIPISIRPQVIRMLADSADRVMVFEPLRKTLTSVLFVFLSLVPAIVLPVWFLRRPGRLRRFLWCWLAPIAPLFFWWDGVVSCLRMWNNDEWHAAIDQLPGHRPNVTVSHTLFSQLATWPSCREKNRANQTKCSDSTNVPSEPTT